jgi:hypothetical protein
MHHHDVYSSPASTSQQKKPWVELGFHTQARMLKAFLENNMVGIQIQI